MRIRVLFLAAVAAVAFSPVAMACGDSLYRVGKGVSYRNYSVPLPGTLLVYAVSPDARSLAEMLADTGHTVHVVSTTAELDRELGSGQFDVVIAPYAESTVAQATAASGASFMPIAADRQEAKAAEQQYRHVVQAGDDLKVYLKTIHKTLKSRA